MKVLRSIAGALAAWAFVSCGSGGETSSASATAGESSSPEPPVALTCETSTRTVMSGGEYPEEDPPVGFDTPEQAAEQWVTSVKQSRRANLPVADYVLTTDGAWVLRADGTAVARIYFLDDGKVDGYVVHGYEACADE